MDKCKEANKRKVKYKNSQTINGDKTFSHTNTHLPKRHTLKHTQIHMKTHEKNQQPQERKKPQKLYRKFTEKFYLNTIKGNKFHVFCIAYYTKTNKERKVKHTQKKLTNKKQFVILFSSTRWQTRAVSKKKFFFSVITADIRFVLSALKQCDTTNGTLAYDDINDNNERWRRK